MSPQKEFEQTIRNSVHSHHWVLDAGCGRKANMKLKGSCHMVVGVDIDAQIANNTGIDAAIRADLSRLPFKDGTFDIITSWWVLEHLDAPQTCFAEFARVCKYGGTTFLGTPSLLHYASLLAASTPFWFHQWFRQFFIGDKDGVYPTRYKANTPRKMKRMMKDVGFTTVEVRCIDSGPGYFRWLTPLYAIGLIYHRLVNRFDVFAPFRDSIIGVFRRQSSPHGSDERE
jgi:ubiquinone/menaquinone biosynthesis C-methylase UbiE